VTDYILQGLEFGLIYSEEAYLRCCAAVQINKQVRRTTKNVITHHPGAKSKCFIG